MLLRRSRLAYLGCGSLFIWVTVTWYFIVSGPLTPYYWSEDVQQLNVPRTNLSRKVEILANALSKQKDENARLLEMIKKDDGSPIASVSADNSQHQSVQPIAVLVIACNRPRAVTNHIDQLLRLRPSKEQFPIIVSQDCQHEETAQAIQRYGDEVIFMQQPDQSDIEVPSEHKAYQGYYKISRHYRWALHQTFSTHGFNATIITEDDLNIATDFFDYFAGTLGLLELDPTLWCVSAWNDNGKEGVIEERADLLYRTDFFSGLGWMMRKSLWEELGPRWPAGFWDDWMRRPDVRMDRACIRPEVSRTAMSRHGEDGVSEGLFYETHLKFIKLNSVKRIFFSKVNLSYLLKDTYDLAFINRVYSAPPITQAELIAGHFAHGASLPKTVRLTYLDKITFESTARAFNLMGDFKSGVPRTAYRGVVPFMYGKIRVYLSPVANWSGYDPTWLVELENY